MRASLRARKSARASTAIGGRITPSSTRRWTTATGASAAYGISIAIRCPPWATRSPTILAATRADFVLGDRDGTTCDPAFTRLVADSARGFGYSVAINDPYKGVEIVRKHGRPAENRHSLQIELKRTLYMDERTLEINEGYARLQRDLTRLAEILAAFVRERTGG